MIAFDTLGLFFVTTIGLAVLPGPDNIFVLTQSAVHGRVAGWWATLGMCTGLLFHTVLVALGVAALFQTSALAFDVLKMLGAAYLLYLAWQAFRADAQTQMGSAGRTQSRLSLYLRGVVMCSTNPKVAIFFLAFLPQFTDPARGSLAGQLLLLGGVCMVATLLVFSSIAWAAGFVGGWLQRSARAQRLMNRIAGTVFVTLAVRLASSTR